MLKVQVYGVKKLIYAGYPPSYHGTLWVRMLVINMEGLLWITDHCDKFAVDL
jgi:hypothetical protein